MKKIGLLLILVFTLFSCAKEGWTDSDKERFIKDCLSGTGDVENAEKICECGLEKAVTNYKSLKEAEKAIDKMTDEQILKIFEDCTL